MNPSLPQDRLGVGRSPKISAAHLQRKAIVYVRQSSLQQVAKNQESTRLQYALTERALQLGWSREQIEVIDDLGRSGASAEGRPGFQRLVAEVSLDQVGLILGIEMSRLARSCRDWHQLLEVCALFSTLIADPEGIYDPANHNDRLLLGLKGTISEAELHVLRRRMNEGKQAKAMRGELGKRVPMGYLRHPSGEVIKDPDERVQSLVMLIFEQFAARKTVHGVLRYLVSHDLQLPMRMASGPRKGELHHVRPNRPTLANLLKNPIYAGAYVYGRRPTEAKRKKPGRPGTGRTVAGVGQWPVFLPDQLPAYISWEQFLAIQAQLQENEAQHRGSTRHGPTLLCGMLTCGRCGLRMSVGYSGRNPPRYVCYQQTSTYGGPACQHVAARALDEPVALLLLQALHPSAIEVSLQAAEDLEAENARLHQLQQQKREQAQYEVDRALRQYDAVEPENRLLARTLERRVEEALAAQQEVEEAHRRFLVQQRRTLSAEEREMIRALSKDLPSLWNAPTTTIEDRMAILRMLVERIEVEVLDDSERVRVCVQWAGGRQTQTEVVRPVARFEQLSYYEALVERIASLRSAGHSSEQIAEQLNALGFRPPKRRQTFNEGMVRMLASRLGLTQPTARPSPTPPVADEHEWTIATLAAELQMPSITLDSWRRRGWVRGRKTYDERWLLWADEPELTRLRALRAAPKGGWARRGLDPALTTPR